MKDNEALFSPIVLMCTDETPFGEYLAEMLHTEGIGWFKRAASWNEVESLREDADVLILPQGARAELTALREWLDEGRSVVAIRPTAALAELAELRPLDRVASERILKIDAPFGIDAARAHGEVDLYELDAHRAAEVHAHVVDNGERYPAVVSAPCGRGRIVIFAYDLPRSIALTRQGNPEWAGSRGADFGSNTFRPPDLFVRDAGKETWLDFPSASTPMADVQQRLFAYLLSSSVRGPLPRLWHLPHAKRTVLSVVGDSDGADPEVVSAQLHDVAAFGGRMSTFLIDYTLDRTDAETVTRWRADGHEISVHPDYGLHGDKSRPDRETMLLTQRTILERFRARFGFTPRTIRNHSICWVGFAGQPEIEHRLGIRLNSSYTYASVFAKPPCGGPPVGYLNGSGQPQKFVDERGGVIDIYQLGVQVCDEMLKSSYLGFDADAAWRETKNLIDASLKRWHSFLVLSFHPITYYSNTEAKRWLRDCILPYAREQGLPIWSTEMILDFADMRRGCWLGNAERSDGAFAVEFYAPSGGAGLTLMMPAQIQKRSLAALTVNGADVSGSEARLADGRWRFAIMERDRNQVVAHYS